MYVCSFIQFRICYGKEYCLNWDKKGLNKEHIDPRKTSWLLLHQLMGILIKKINKQAKGRLRALDKTTLGIPQHVYQFRMQCLCRCCNIWWIWATIFSLTISARRFQLGLVVSGFSSVSHWGEIQEKQHPSEGNSYVNMIHSPICLQSQLTNDPNNRNKANCGRSQKSQTLFSQHHSCKWNLITENETGIASKCILLLHLSRVATYAFFKMPADCKDT